MSRRAALLVALLALPSVALAHALPDPTVIVVAPSKDGLDVRVNDMTQPGEESIALKRRFDENGDGRLEENERTDLLDFAVARAEAHLAVLQSGQRLSLSIAGKALHGTDQPVDSSESLSLDLVLRARPAPGAGGATEVTIRDWRDDGHVVRCAVMGQGVRLLAVSPGKLDASAPIATGIDLSRESALSLRYGE